MITAANLFGLYSQFQALSAICLKSTSWPSEQVETMFWSIGALFGNRAFPYVKSNECIFIGDFLKQETSYFVGGFTIVVVNKDCCEAYVDIYEKANYDCTF